MAIFVKRARDPDLRELIERQLPVHLRHYEEKRRLLLGDAPVTQGSADLASGDAHPDGRATPQALAPDLDLQESDDRTIAFSYYLTLRRTGREYAWAAFDSPSPALRTFLEGAFLDCSRQALELERWLARHRYYPQPGCPEDYIEMLRRQYREAPSRV